MARLSECRPAVQMRDPENLAGAAAGVGPGERGAPMVAVRAGDFDEEAFHRNHLVAFDGEQFFADLIRRGQAMRVG